MAAALKLLIICCLLQSAQCGQFEVTVPQTLQVLKGSCVTINCSFDIESKYEKNLDDTCKAIWKTEKEKDKAVFDSTEPTKIHGEFQGNLKKKDCTTTLNNMQDSDKYIFRLECNNPLKNSFVQRSDMVDITVDDQPTRPFLTPSTLEVKEGASVSLTCSAPAPCLSHPTTLTWSPSLGHRQENHSQKGVMTSVMNFNASHLHDRKTISCTATYSKHGGTEASVSTNLTAAVSFAPQILPSSNCTQTSAQLSCSCETVGNPSPSIRWYLDGLPVDHSDNFSISSEPLNDTGLRSIIAVNQSQWRDLSTLLCRSSNSLGSASQRFCVNSVQTFAGQVAPQILPSSNCTQTSAQLSCSCETVGNPSPSIHWYLDGLPVDHSDNFSISSEPLNDTGLRSIITVNQTQWRDLSTLLCRSSNSLGSASQRFCVNSVESSQVAPQILPSSNCTQTSAQLSCSCETVGNPSPSIRWYLDGLPVDQSDNFSISSEPLNDTGLRSIIAVNQPQWRDLSTLLCRSSNSLGSASQHFWFHSLEHQTFACQDKVMFPVFISTIVALLVLVCALLFVIRALKTHQKLPNSEYTGDTRRASVNQLLTSGEEDEVPKPENINVDTNELSLAEDAPPATISEPNNSNQPNSGPNDAERDRKSSEKANDEGADVIYSNVTWKKRSKKQKGVEPVDMHPPAGSFLEEERCMSGEVCSNFLNQALEMQSLYDEKEPRNVKKEVECEYAEVKFKDKSAVNK